MKECNIEFIKSSNHNDCKHIYEKALERYIKEKIISAVILLDKFESFDNYYKSISKNVKENYKKAVKREYIFKEINKKNHIDDIIEINKSSKIRQNKPMSDSYYKSTVESFGGYPKEYIEINNSSQCVFHHSRVFGIFKENKLVAYGVYVRDGNICGYSQILGHADYLNDGIMHLLQIEIMKLVLSRSRLFQRTNYFIYAGWNDGTDGLQTWKKRNCFEPVYLQKK